MKIIGTTNKKIMCQWTTFGKSIENLSNYLNIPTKIYDFEDLCKRNIEQEKDKVIFIFEAGHPQHAGLSMKDMKQWFPNSIFIALGSDTIFYIKKFKKDQLDYDSIDLLLDVQQEAVDYYSKRVPSETWMWTISDWMIWYIENSPSLHTKCTQCHGLGWEDDPMEGRGAPLDSKITCDKCNGTTFKKSYDFIGVYHPGTFSHGYRKNLLDYLTSKQLKFTNGGGNGHEDNDGVRLLSQYHESYFTLGTTSCNDNNYHGAKGFRDWIGPFCGSPLVYDNWPQFIKMFGDVVPYYEYDNLDSLYELYKKYINNPFLYQKTIQDQQKWARQHTIEKQLVHYLHKYQFV